MRFNKYLEAQGLLWLTSQVSVVLDFQNVTKWNEVKYERVPVTGNKVYAHEVSSVNYSSVVGSESDPRTISSLR